MSTRTKSISVGDVIRYKNNVLYKFFELETNIERFMKKVGESKLGLLLQAFSIIQDHLYGYPEEKLTEYKAISATNSNTKTHIFQKHKTDDICEIVILLCREKRNKSKKLMLSDVHDAWAFSRLKQYDGHKWSLYKDRGTASMDKKTKPLKDFDENLSIKDLPKNDVLFLIDTNSKNSTNSAAIKPSRLHQFVPFSRLDQEEIAKDTVPLDTFTIIKQNDEYRKTLDEMSKYVQFNDDASQILFVNLE